MITFEVTGIKHDENGGITKVEWTAKKDTAIPARQYGTVEFTPNSESNSFVSFESLTEEQVSGWVESSLGEEAVAQIEANIDAVVAQHEAKQSELTQQNTPWYVDPIIEMMGDADDPRKEA